jgi:hypothetical protein
MRQSFHDEQLLLGVRQDFMAGLGDQHGFAQADEFEPGAASLTNWIQKSNMASKP